MAGHIFVNKFLPKAVLIDYQLGFKEQTSAKFQLE